VKRNQWGRRAIVGPLSASLLLACLLIGELGLPRLAMSSEEAKETAVIQGTVRSLDGGPLYGILVKAKGDGKNYETTVVSDGKPSH
jgi:hypothetical protein